MSLSDLYVINEILHTKHTQSHNIQNYPQSGMTTMYSDCAANNPIPECGINHLLSSSESETADETNENGDDNIILSDGDDQYTPSLSEHEKSHHQLFNELIYYRLH
jgi:hypothetical protein